MLHECFDGCGKVFMTVEAARACSAHAPHAIEVARLSAARQHLRKINSVLVKYAELGGVDVVMLADHVDSSGALKRAPYVPVWVARVLTATYLPPEARARLLVRLRDDTLRDAFFAAWRLAGDPADVFKAFEVPTRARRRRGGA